MTTSSINTDIAYLPITIKQGADLTYECVWSDDNGNPMNLTGYHFRLVVRPYLGSTTELLALDSNSTTGSRIVIYPTLGQFNLIFAGADTTAMTPDGVPFNRSSAAWPLYKIGVQDLQYTDNNGNNGYLSEGPFNLDLRVT